MPFDPFHSQAYHADLRQRIQNGESGLAQSEVGDVLVSYENGSITHGGWIEKPVKDLLRDIVDEIIIDVARGEGICGPATFLRSRVVFMIEDRRLFADHWKKKQKEANDLEAFYLEGEGAQYLK